LTNERIYDAHASVQEISPVSSGDGQTVDGRGRRDEAVLNWHGLSGCAKTRQDFRPFQTRVRVPGQTMKTVDPGFESTGFKPAGQPVFFL
jgi:hypothetical protein